MHILTMQLFPSNTFSVTLSIIVNLDFQLEQGRELNVDLVSSQSVTKKLILFHFLASIVSCHLLAITFFYLIYIATNLTLMTLGCLQHLKTVQHHMNIFW